MNKQEAFKYLREKHGYVPFVMLFDMFDEEEEIPEWVLREPKMNSGTNVIYCSTKVAEELSKIM